MYQLQPLTLVSVDQGIARHKDYTWAGLGFTIGPKSAALVAIKADLEATGYHDMGEGVVISTKGKLSEYHKD